MSKKYYVHYIAKNVPPAKTYLIGKKPHVIQSAANVGAAKLQFRHWFEANISRRASFEVTLVTTDPSVIMQTTTTNTLKLLLAKLHIQTQAIERELKSKGEEYNHLLDDKKHLEAELEAAMSAEGIGGVEVRRLTVTLHNVTVGIKEALIRLNLKREILSDLASRVKTTEASLAKRK